jgi:hypothetical protein
MRDALATRRAKPAQPLKKPGRRRRDVRKDAPHSPSVAGVERVAAEAVLRIVEPDGFGDGDAWEFSQVAGNMVSMKSG